MNNILIINLDKCFECGGDMDEMHHVIPKVRGGKKTIPLCSKCHGLAHGIHRKGRHGDLIREGAKKAKENAERLGLPSPYQGRKNGTGDTIEVTLKKHEKTIKTLKSNPTLSLRNIAKLVSDEDYNVSANTVKKVKTILININI